MLTQKAFKCNLSAELGIQISVNIEVQHVLMYPSPVWAGDSNKAQQNFPIIAQFDYNSALKPLVSMVGVIMMILHAGYLDHN